MVSHPKGIGHDGQRRVDGAARWEEAGIDNVEVINVMGLAVGIEGGALGVAAKTNRPVLVRHSGKRNTLTDKQVSGKQPLITLMAMDGALGLPLHDALKLGDEALMPFFVVRLVRQD